MVRAVVDSRVCNFFKMIVSSFQERFGHDHIPSLALRKFPQSKFCGIDEGASYAIIGPKPIDVRLPCTQPDSQSKAFSYYDSRTAAWHHICLTAIDVAISESGQNFIDNNDRQLNAADSTALSILELMSSDPKLDWETLFAMIDRVLYDREPLDSSETLGNLQRFMTFLDKRLENSNRVHVRSAAMWIKSGQIANVSTVIKHLPSDVSDPYSAFSDILQRLVAEQTSDTGQQEEFVFPSDRTRLLPERDRDLAEWLWWDRQQP